MTSISAAEVIAPDGTSQGPLNLTGAEDEASARELATKLGQEWLQANSFDRITIMISFDGRGLEPVKLSK